MTKARLLSTLIAVAGLASAAGAQLRDSEVRLEGGGQHRAQLNAMQLKPFNTALLGELSDWIGAPVTAEGLKDRPLLIVTWTSFVKSNNRAVQLAQDLARKHADKGLVTLVVHNPRGFDSAKSVAEELKLSVPIAADPQGKFRAGLSVDQDPDFYVVDRAGTLRFADIETSGVERAVEIVVNETAEDAANVPAATARAAADEAAAKMAIRPVKGAVTPGKPVTVTFTPPSEEAYTKARWPKVMAKTGVSEYDQLADKINKEKPELPLAEEGFVAGRPDSTGRVVLVYLFDPFDSQIRTVVDDMSRLQSAHARDLVVIGNMRQLSGTASTDSEREEQERRRAEAFKTFAQNNTVNHWFNSIPFEISQMNTSQLVIPVSSRREASLAFLVSTDGRCRWVGNQYWDGFHTCVKDFIEADPGVQARRRAEEAAAKLGQ